MFCTECGAQIGDDDLFCTKCGKSVKKETSMVEESKEKVILVENKTEDRPYIANYIPGMDYTPIGMWGYFGYSILFGIPVVGFILILVFALGGTRNINLRNYSRSMFCTFIIGLVLFVFIFIISLLVGSNLFDQLENTFNHML